MDGDNQQIGRLAIKAPPFWPEEPELWFAQLEGQFTLGGITQDATKYLYVIAHIKTKYARDVRDIITQPPEAGKYETIKKALIQRLTITQEQRTRQLLEHEELGDRKPSQFLRHLRTLAGSNILEHLLRTLWIGRLPSQMQIILTTRSEDRLEEVAEQADRIAEVTNRSIAATTNSTTEKQTLEEQIKKLTEQVAKLSRRQFNRSRSRSRNWSPRRRSQSKSQNQTSQEDEETCYYHRRFGNKVNKCQQPCKFKKENEEESH
ncbi:uncharacterized protein LOC112639983 [Camponotus floridanus]|uniref:uncharacterized protein LOC112639983 n=1 Tax=Camponotus floridanus TaxID=104421 RepID=UPI000DC68D36|nr:uncharacterized protein LOC112639983 [Camponotus floridanus]